MGQCVKFFSCVVLLWVWASVVQAAPVTVSEAYVRLPVPGQTMTAAFFRLQSTSDEPLVLSRVSCSCAQRTELHASTSADGIMKMRKQSSFTLAAGARADFAPGGWHVMLFDVDTSLRSSDTAELILHFADGEAVPVTASIKSVFDEPDHKHHHH